MTKMRVNKNNFSLTYVSSKFQGYLNRFFLVSLSAVFLLGMDTSIILSQETSAEIEPIKFFCDLTQETPVIIAQTRRGNIPFVRLNSQVFVNTELTPKTRCEEISRRFQDAYNKGDLKYLLPGKMNGYPVVCYSRSKEGLCGGILLTLTKDTCMKKTKDDLKALLPETNFGYTFLDHPTFFWYMPELTAQNIPVKFRIREVNRNEKGKESFKLVYATTLQYRGSGVMSFTLSDKVPSLKEGQEYEWAVTIECSDIDWISMLGRIKRLSTDNPKLSDELAKAPIEDYPAIFAREGIWYDALSTLAALRREQPSNTDLANDWAEILKMIGYNDIAKARLIEPSRVPSRVRVRVRRVNN